MSDERPKLILHAGMGKSGSSAIQRSLEQNESVLKAGNTMWTGMWLERLLGDDTPRKNEFFKIAPEDWRARGEALALAVHAQYRDTGTRTFVTSNESIYHHAESYGPFLEAVHRTCDLEMVIYCRSPASYLPSAYGQWGIRHKTRHGPIKSYSELARVMVRQYEDVIAWKQLLGDACHVFYYDGIVDVVAHFFDHLGLMLESEGSNRFYERPDDIELLLRGLFNDRFDGQAFPMIYDREVRPFHGNQVRELASVTREWFDFGPTNAVILENRELFERFEQVVGFDLLHETPEPKRAPGTARMRHRLVDYLAKMVLEQSHRIAKLEGRLNALDQQRGQDGTDG